MLPQKLRPCFEASRSRNLQHLRGTVPAGNYAVDGHACDVNHDLFVPSDGIAVCGDVTAAEVERRPVNILNV